MTERHKPGSDWTCSCGYDYFGGSAAYSWQLFEAHLVDEGYAMLAEDPEWRRQRRPTPPELDGTDRGAVRFLTGFTDEEIDDLGGLDD